MNKKKNIKTKKYDIFEDIIHWNSINDSNMKVNHYYIVVNNNNELEWFCHLLNMKKISGLGRYKSNCDYDTNSKQFKTAQGGFNDEFPKKFVLDYNYGYEVSMNKINTDYYYAIDVNLSDTVQYFKFLNNINNNKEMFNKYYKELTMIEVIADENEKRIIQKQQEYEHSKQDERERQYEEYQKLIKREKEDEEMFERAKERNRQLRHGISQYEMDLDTTHSNFW